MSGGLATAKSDHTLSKPRLDDDRDRVIRERLSKLKWVEHRPDKGWVVVSGLPVSEPVQYHFADVDTLLKTNVNRMVVNPMMEVRDVAIAQALKTAFLVGSKSGRVDQRSGSKEHSYGQVGDPTGEALPTWPTKTDDDWPITVPRVTVPGYVDVPHEILDELETVQEAAHEEGCPAPPSETVNDARNLLRRMYSYMPFPYDVTHDGEGGLAIQALGNGIAVLVILSPNEDDQCYVSLDEENRRSIYGRRGKVFGRFLRTALRDLRDAESQRTTHR
ncbi:MAG: hypothetical protein F4107_09105 [Gemmatimonadetes bacterium]|nr:hypothetical protein [Gemmatimonadota bacterium]MYI66073.1 hypothetical protein [Gemmatimonadota bacterium]